MAEFVWTSSGNITRQNIVDGLIASEKNEQTKVRPILEKLVKNPFQILFCSTEKLTSDETKQNIQSLKEKVDTYKIQMSELLIVQWLLKVLVHTDKGIKIKRAPIK